VAAPATQAPPTSGPLPRVIGTFGLALTVINMVVGAGVFGMPALLAAGLGRNALLALAACALLVLCLNLCFAEAATRVPVEGGYYAIAARAFGPFAGSVTGSLGWIGNGAVATASVAALLLALVRGYVPALGRPAVAFVAVALTYVALAAMSILSTRLSMRVGGTLGVTKLVPLALLALALPFVLRAEALPAAPLPDLRAFGQGTVLVFFAFLGSEAALCVCGECRDPSRTIPRGLLLAITGIALVYGALQLSAASVLGPALAGAGAEALPRAAQAIFGGAAGPLVAITAAASMLSILVADATCTPRVLFAMGRDGLVPRRFGLVHPVHQTPYVAIAVYAGVCGALAASGTFRQLAILASSATLLLDLVIVAALLRLRRDGVRGEAPPFVAPGGVVLPLVTMAAVVALLATLTRGELLAAAGLVVVAAGGYAAARIGGGVARPG
jgi:APA family basic amino acid/polyamine antiporter